MTTHSSPPEQGSSTQQQESPGQPAAPEQNSFLDMTMHYAMKASSLPEDICLAN